MENDPLSVDPLWAAWFDGYELGSGGAPREKENAGNAADTSPYTVPPESAERRGRVNQLIRAYRVMGHQCARFNPLAPPDQTGCPVTPEDMGFQEEDLDQPVNIGTFMDGGTLTLREIINRLQKIYCGAIGFEYHHIDNLGIRSWIEEKSSSGQTAWIMARKSGEKPSSISAGRNCLRNSWASTSWGKNASPWKEGKEPSSCWTP